MFFAYLAEEDWTLFECTNCGNQEEEQILQEDFPCPCCEEGWMIPV